MAAALLLRSRGASVDGMAPLLIACLLVPSPVSAQAATAPEQPAQLTTKRLFDLADAARDRGDYALARQLYEALAVNEQGELRREALFRTAMMLADNQQEYARAALLLRQILDEAPGAARVRVELARMQAMTGNLRAAERELRAAQATGLPPAVEQMVRFYAQALNARRPLGVSFQIAVAPDSNINRATRSGTLETIIGDFVLDDDARKTSGIGLTLQGQAFARTGIGAHADLLVRLSGGGDLYRSSQFDDYQLALQVGPQYSIGAGRLDLAATASHRWFGRNPYSMLIGVNADYQMPVSKSAQLRVTGSAGRLDNRVNDLQTGAQYSLRTRLDAALDARTGVGGSLLASRANARDPGYATASGGVDGYAFRELGATTLVLEVNYLHLEADRRLALYPRRRVDDRLGARISSTFRGLRIGRFAPLLRIGYEKNMSRVTIYDYDRLSGEIGVTGAF
ncbi:porin family protein [Croceicoccus sp. F390]|uniref:Porin family protein n=1 Tax=Croceicoccus esteveae TaxID=3075597 RepID=A0ABU2ZK56_9SPHN|nr:porin family protein [Croceicoccus sp. F390]MDT0575954.1 porin family protein [Croceicoccus sp. F390]